MPSIETPLLIIGHGPACLVAAKVLSGRGLPCLVAGHEPVDDSAPVVLDPDSLAILEPHGVLGVLRPYAAAQDPFTIAPLQFEQGLKHHCVADMLVTVYDEMSLVDRRPTHNHSGRQTDAGVDGVLSDGRSHWEIHADALLDVAALPTELNAAIHAAANYAVTLLDAVLRRPPVR